MDCRIMWLSRKECQGKSGQVHLWGQGFHLVPTSLRWGAGVECHALENGWEVQAMTVCFRITMWIRLHWGPTPEGQHCPGERLMFSQIRCAPAVDKTISPVIMHDYLWLLLLTSWRVAASSNEAFRSLCCIFSQAPAIPSSQYITGHIPKCTCERKGGVVFQRVVRLKVSPELPHASAGWGEVPSGSVGCLLESPYRLRGSLLSAPPWEVLDWILPPAMLHGHSHCLVVRTPGFTATGSLWVLNLIAWLILPIGQWSGRTDSFQSEEFPISFKWQEAHIITCDRNISCIGGYLSICFLNLCLLLQDNKVPSL